MLPEPLMGSPPVALPHSPSVPNAHSLSSSPHPIPSIQTEIPCCFKGQTSHQKSSPQLEQRLTTGSEVRPAVRNPGHKDQKAKKETETKQQSTHPTETNLEINTLTYNYPKSISLNQCKNIVNNSQGNMATLEPNYPTRPNIPT